MSSFSRSSNARKYLTKSLFQTATTCPRKLRYAIRPDLYPRRSDPLLASLAEEGRKFELYCRLRHFYHGKMIAKGSGNASKYSPSSLGSGSDEAIVDDIVERTRSLLLGEDEATILEGAIRYENHLIRADVLQTSSDENVENDDCNTKRKRSVSLIEIKAKSWNSANYDLGVNPIIGKRGGIKSDFLPYIRDVAYQKWVLEQAYPEDFSDVRTYLMMPDKAKIANISKLNQFVDNVYNKTSGIAGSGADYDAVFEKASETIAMEDLAALVDVTEYADRVIHDDLLQYPGSAKGVPFVTAARQWAQSIDATSADDTADDLCPIGSHCKNCEFRLGKNAGDPSLRSGFDICWKEATGLKPEEFQDGSAVVDLYHGTKSAVTRFIKSGKYRLSDLNCEDLGFTEDGFEIKTKKEREKAPKDGGMTRSKRQLYQAVGFPNQSSSEEISYRLDVDYLINEMDSWNYPYHFIDFETSATSLPFFSGMAPFATVAFQYSHHTLHEDGRFEHASQFLHAKPGSCPNESFLCALAESIGGCTGSVFRWGVHEDTVLAALLKSREDDLAAENSDVLRPLLQDGDRAMVDLMRVASLGYFVAGSGGSSSIKRLLCPTLEASPHLERIYGSPTYSSSNFTNTQWFQKNDENDRRISVRDPYDILKEHQGTAFGTSVADGGAALSAYKSLQCDDMSHEERSAKEESLLRYCELDTLAMTMIVQAWQGFLEETG